MMHLFFLFISVTTWAQQPPAAPSQPLSAPPVQQAPGVKPIPTPQSLDQADMSDFNVPQAVSDIIEKFPYDPTSKRDPFQPLVAIKPVSMLQNIAGPFLPIQKFSLEQLQLSGVIWGGKKAMAMIVDPSKRVYYLRENDKIGNSNGYVAKIREGEIIVVETVTTDDGRMVQQTRILKISKQPPASN